MTGPERSTEEIIRDLKQGRDEKENFRRLYLRYSAPIRLFFEKKGVTESEELKDDVFFVVYKSVKELREEASFEYWLFTIARNKYKNWLKQEKRRMTIEISVGNGQDDAPVIDLPAASTVDPEREVLDREKLEKVSAALKQLPDQKRMVVILAWVEGRSPHEIASILPIKVNTVYAHLHQAQKILREKLGKYFDDV